MVDTPYDLKQWMRQVERRLGTLERHTHPSATVTVAAQAAPEVPPGSNTMPDPEPDSDE